MNAVIYNAYETWFFAGLAFAARGVELSSKKMTKYKPVFPTINPPMSLHTVVKLLRDHKPFSTAIVVCSGITAASLAITAGLQHAATKPLPVLTVKHKTLYEDTWVDVFIEKGSHGPLRDLTYTHHNLGCMADKGYHVRSVTSGGFTGGEPVLELLNRNKSYDDFIADCKECGVNTFISVEGGPRKSVDWVSNAFTC